MRLRGGEVRADRRRTRFAPMPASRSTDWCAGRSPTASPASKRGPARRARSAAQSTATRISGGATSASSSRRSRLLDRDGPRPRRAGRRDGVRLRLQPAAPDGRDRAVGRFPRRPPAIPTQLRAVARESLAFRKRTQPLAIAERRLHLSESGSGARSRARRHSVVGRSAGRSRRPQGRARRRGARVADARATSSSTRAGRRPADVRRSDRALQATACIEQFGVRLREEIVYMGFDRRRSRGGRRTDGDIAD